MILAMGSASVLFCLITYPWRVHMFGECQNKVLAAGIALAFLVWGISGPSVEEVHSQHGKLVIVSFWASWCGVTENL